MLLLKGKVEENILLISILCRLSIFFLTSPLLLFILCQESASTGNGVEHLVIYMPSFPKKKKKEKEKQ